MDRGSVAILSYVFFSMSFYAYMQTKDPTQGFSVHFLLPEINMKPTIKMQGEI